MRIFVAIDISDETRRAVSDYIERLRGEFSGTRVNWTRAEKLHLTLKFFGEVSNEQLKKLTEAIEAAATAFAPFSLQIAGAGVFPSKQNARVLWLGVADESDGLRRLSAIIESACALRGFPKEKRSFKSHLTIARLRQNPDASLIEKHLAANFTPTAPFAASEIVIYRSELSPHGSVYSAISKHRLKENSVADLHR